MLTSIKVDIEVMEHHARRGEASPELGDGRAASTPESERKKRVKIRGKMHSVSPPRVSRAMHGSPILGELPNLSPSPKLDQKYSLLEMARLMEMEEKSGFVLGAGAGPFHVLGMNSELMPNLSYRGEEATNLTHYTRVSKQGGCVYEKTSGDCGLMANLFGSDGSPGMNFTEAIQKALQAEYGERTVSLGGVFVIKKGKAKLHVMPREEVNEWLRYFGRSAPLVCLSVFHSYNPGLDLRMEHTHFLRP